MMTDTILLLEIRLLLIKYGRTAVIEALAHAGESTVDELERQILGVAESKGARNARNTNEQAGRVVDRLLKERPDLERFAALYRAKLLLPSLREVKAFLAAHQRRASVKTREAALPKVLQVLRELPDTDLVRLEQASSSSRDPDAFSMLADELMSPSQRQKP